MPLALRTTAVAPIVTSLEGFLVERVTDPAVMASVQGRDADSMVRRFADGHRAYVGRLGGEIVTWGWVATRVADIGELQFRFAVPNGDRYLWNFVTRADQRGRGHYPRLIDGIIRAESGGADRFWIAWAPENHASGSGITRAGFRRMAELSFDEDREPAVHGVDPHDVMAASTLLGVPVSSHRLARCWRCVRAAVSGERPCANGDCRCDYQRPERGCAAA
jgi:hypothetical protein